MKQLEKLEGPKRRTVEQEKPLPFDTGHKKAAAASNPQSERKTAKWLIAATLILAFASSIKLQPEFRRQGYDLASH